MTSAMDEHYLSGMVTQATESAEADEEQPERVQTGSDDSKHLTPDSDHPIHMTKWQDNSSYRTSVNGELCDKLFW